MSSVLESVFMSMDMFMFKVNIIKQFVQSCSSVYYHMLVLCWGSAEHQVASDSLTNPKVDKTLTIFIAFLLPLSILDS